MPALLPLLQIVCEGYEKLVEKNGESEVNWIKLEEEEHDGERMVQKKVNSPRMISMERHAPLKKIAKFVTNDLLRQNRHASQVVG